MGENFCALLNAEDSESIWRLVTGGTSAGAVQLHSDLSSRL